MLPYNNHNNSRSMFGPITYAEHRRQCNAASAARCYARRGYGRQSQRAERTAQLAPVIAQARAQPVADSPAVLAEREWDNLAPAVPAPPASNGTFIIGIFVLGGYWEDDEGELWDWLTVKGIRDTSGEIELLLQWDGRQDNGRLWPDSWEPARQCNGAWEWMYETKLCAGRVGAYWEEWADLISRRYLMVQLGALEQLP